MLKTAAIWKSLNAPRRLTLIAGPGVSENERLRLRVADMPDRLRDLAKVFNAVK